jgi:phosphoglycolate phosphatase
MNSVIIFDFDGTIADTLDAVVKIVNEHSEYFGYRKVTKQDIPYLQGKKPKEILSYLGMSIIKLPFWIQKIHSEINKEILNLTPTVNILPVITRLKEIHTIGVLTSNTHENVKKFLVKNNLDLFNFIYTGKSVFGKSHVINKIIKQQKINKNSIIYVCDEVRDIEAARKSGIKVVAVTWGYNSKEALQKEEPDFIIETPDELIRILI